MRRRMLALTLGALSLGVLALPGPTTAQVLQGSVVDRETLNPVPTALVRLLDEERIPVAMSLADLAGGYRLEVPAPGQYYLSVERLGYEAFVSHLLAMESADGVYPVDLEMVPEPIPIPGLAVRARRFEAIAPRVRTLIGVNPTSLRFEPITRAEIDDHLEQGHDLEDILRWQNLASITVKTTIDGPCFQYRARGCVTVYLDGIPVNPELVPILPLELVETVIVVTPWETSRYENGGILLYTSGWIG